MKQGLFPHYLDYRLLLHYTEDYSTTRTVRLPQTQTGIV
jgi:hypothetical protein